jgi:hypothetical protein
LNSLGCLEQLRNVLERVETSFGASKALPFSVCSIEDGTLTRTMKPRRAAVMAKYKKQVAELEAKLR